MVLAVLPKAVSQAVARETTKILTGDPRHQSAGGDRHHHKQEGPEQGRRANRLLQQLWQ